MKAPSLTLRAFDVRGSALRSRSPAQRYPASSRGRPPSDPAREYAVVWVASASVAVWLRTHSVWYSRKNRKDRSDSRRFKPQFSVYSKRPPCGVGPKLPTQPQRRFDSSSGRRTVPGLVFPSSSNFLLNHTTTPHLTLRLLRSYGPELMQTQNGIFGDFTNLEGLVLFLFCIKT